jgi:hypothetical protein
MSTNLPAPRLPRRCRRLTTLSSASSLVLLNHLGDETVTDTCQRERERVSLEGDRDTLGLVSDTETSGAQVPGKEEEAAPAQVRKGSVEAIAQSLTPPLSLPPRSGCVAYLRLQYCVQNACELQRVVILCGQKYVGVPLARNEPQCLHILVERLNMNESACPAHKKFLL